MIVRNKLPIMIETSSAKLTLYIHIHCGHTSLENNTIVFFSDLWFRKRMKIHKKLFSNILAWKYLSKLVKYLKQTNVLFQMRHTLTM